MPDPIPELFIPELDRYETEVARRIGPLAARAARTELAAHLTADYDARVELGASAEAARLGALAALGDLRETAAAEPGERAFLWPIIFGPLLGSIPLIATGTAAVPGTVLATIGLVASYAAWLYGVGTDRRLPLREAALGIGLAFVVLLISGRSVHLATTTHTLFVASVALGLKPLTIRMALAFSLAELRRAPVARTPEVGGFGAWLLFVGLFGPAMAIYLGGFRDWPESLPMGLLWMLVFAAGASRVRRPMVFPVVAGGVASAVVSIAPFLPPTNPHTGPAAVAAITLAWAVSLSAQALLAQTVLSAAFSAVGRRLAGRLVRG